MYSKQLQTISRQLKKTTVKDFGAACDLVIDELDDKLCEDMAKHVTDALEEYGQIHLIPPSTSAFNIVFQHYYVNWHIFNIVKIHIAKIILADWDLLIYPRLKTIGFEDKDEGKLQNAVLEFLDKEHTHLGLCSIDIQMLLNHDFNIDTSPMEALYEIYNETDKACTHDNDDNDDDNESDDDGNAEM